VVSCLESFQAVIDDAVEEWEKFCAEWPDMMMGIDPAEESSATETSQEMTRRVLDEIETQVDRLRDISARFESSRDKTKVLREGVSNSSMDCATLILTSSISYSAPAESSRAEYLRVLERTLNFSHTSASSTSH
jgi:hypothetical protein